MKSLKNLIFVFASNISTIISGLLVGFILPLVITVEDYGYYKTFTLYVTYLGLFSLGIIDGIVLEYGGENYDQLNRYKFRSCFRWYIIIHTLIAIIMMYFFYLLHEEYQKRILLMLILNMFAQNIAGFFRQVSEITQRFREYSIIKISQSVLTIVSIVFLFLLTKCFCVEIGYFEYMLIVVGINAVISLWYINLYKELIFGKCEPLGQSFSSVTGLIFNGIPLMLANLCSTLILTIDRQFVNFLFDNRTYATYAFAYNMLAMLTVATSAVSTVLYPSLKRSSIEDASQKFPFYISSFFTVLYAILCLYFPLTQIIEVLLPNYVDSIRIFRIILPGLPVSSTITVIIHNYYKMLGESSKYFRRSITILVVSAVANIVSYLLFKSTESISIASIITMFIWFIYVSGYISKQIGTSLIKDIVFAIISTLLFYMCSAIGHWVWGFILYLVFFGLLLAILQMQAVIAIKKQLLKRL